MKQFTVRVDLSSINVRLPISSTAASSIKTTTDTSTLVLDVADSTYEWQVRVGFSRHCGSMLAVRKHCWCAAGIDTDGIGKYRSRCNMSMHLQSH